MHFQGTEKHVTTLSSAHGNEHNTYHPFPLSPPDAITHLYDCMVATAQAVTVKY